MQLTTIALLTAGSSAASLRGLTTQHPTAKPAVGGSVDLVVYGDSVSDNGRTWHQITDQAWPVVAYQTHQFSNGEVWVEYLSTQLGAQLTDLAIGGATTNSMKTMGFTGPTSTWPVSGMVQQYEQQMLKPSAKETEQQAQIICGGVNDYFFRLTELAAPDGPSKVVQIVVKDIMDLVRTISDAKGKHIFVCDLYPLALTPFAISQGDAKTTMFSQLAELHNTELKNALAGFQEELDAKSQNTQVTTVPLFQSASNAIASMPENQQPCLSETMVVCKDAAKYAFFDTFHPTTATHKLIAEAVAPVFSKALGQIEGGGHKSEIQK